jgi:hypothetical protein
MNKITRFKDIPQFTRDGQYEADFFPASFVKEIERMIAEECLDIDPDFQRGHVWTEEQQVRYLTFFLRGGKTGRTIYINDPNWGNGLPIPGTVVLVDGKQRYRAWQRFINNELQVFGSFYREFTDTLRMTQTMKIHINNLQTRREVLLWYRGINAGGTPHTDEEIAKVDRMIAEEQS